MKHIFSSHIAGNYLIACFWLCILNTSAQTFPGQPNIIFPPGAPPVTVGIGISLCAVSGIGILGNGCSALDHITIDVSHTFDGDIALFLIAPGGQILELSSSNGGGGDNFQITEFRDNTTLFITQGAPPYNGVFRPEGRQTNLVPPFTNTPPLGTFTMANTFNGVNADGNWQLYINDYVAADWGTINNWSMTFNSNGTAPVANAGPDVTICAGGSTTLTASSTPPGATFEWSTGEMNSSIMVSPTINTEYYVTATNGGCSDIDTVKVFVSSAAFTANAGADVPICQGQSTTLTASGGPAGSMYNWSTGQSGTSIMVNPASTTTYTVTVTHLGCSDTDEVTVTVNTAPVVNAGADITICSGTSGILNATGGAGPNTYLWSTGQSGAQISVSPTNTTVYTVTVTVSGCSSSDMVTVNVTPALMVDAGPDITICDGESTTLTATGSPGTYLWSNGQGGLSITVSPSNTTIYSVTVTSGICQSSSTVVVVIGAIVANAGQNQNICAGQSATLSATGGSAYEWSTGEMMQSISVSPPSTTTYTVTVTSGLCTDTDQVIVNVTPYPNANAGPDKSVCRGKSVNLTASGGSEYAWSSGQNIATTTVSPISITTYTVTVSAGGCSSSDQAIVTVLDPPIANAGADVTICKGESTTLDAQGGGDYAWSTGQNIQSITVSPNATTTYAVTVTNADLCTATAQVKVTITQLPALDAGPDQPICFGTSATLNATGTGTFEWSTGEQTQSISVAPIVTTTYYVTLTSSGCNSTDSVQVIIKPLPVVDAGVNQFIFAGNSATLVATGGGTYLWSTTETSDTIVVMPIITTIYTVTVTANGCEGTDEVTVFVNELPDIDLGPDITICLGDSAVLTAAGTVPMGTTFLWSSGADEASITVFPLLDASYSVTVTANSESSIDTINITVITVPLGQPIISGNLEACTGDQFSYSVIPVTGATAYAWTVPPGASILPPIDQSSVTIVFGDAQSGNITVLPSNTCGDGVLATIAVILDTIPIAPASISGPPNICASYTATYQVSSVINATDYQWTVPTGAIILSGQGTSSILVDWNNSGGGQICMSVSNDCGTAPDICLDVTTVLAPTADAGMDPLINCTNLLAILDASGSSPAGLDFLWSTGSTTDTIQTIQSGAYYVTVTNATGCFDVDSVTVFADFNKPSIVIDATANTLTCDVPSVELTTKTNANNPTYVWLNGNAPIGTADSLILNAPGCYKLELTDQNNGCFDTLSYCISENKTVPNLSISGPDQITCKEEIITLLGICNAITPSWNWTTLNGNFIGNVDKEEVKIDHPGKYDLKVKDLLSGCEAVASKTISIDTIQPIVIITAAGFLDCTNLQALINSTGSSTGAEYEYIWTSKGGQILGDTFGLEIRATAEGIYILTIINAVNGCTAFDTAQMLRFAGHPEDVDLALEQPLCVTDCNGQLKIDDKGESLVYSFDGSSFSTIDQFDDLCPGNYALVVQDIFGCEWDTSIVVLQPNPIKVDIGLDTTIISGASVLIVPNFVGTIASVAWTPTGEGTLQGNNYLVSPAVSTIYSLTLTDNKGCIATDTKTIKVKIDEKVFIPTGFTPNGDGENDVFTIFGKPGESHVKSLRIFNRWGDLVFESLDFDPNDTSKGWDGSFRGKMINSGVFVYSAEIEYSSGNSELRSGDMLLSR